MADEKVSPGPWRQGTRQYCEDLVLDANGIVVCEVGMVNMDNNMPLIIAAPTIAAQLAEAVALLRKHEWIEHVNGYGKFCPECHGVEPGEVPMGNGGGHAQDCLFAAFLARIDAEKGGT